MRVGSGENTYEWIDSWAGIPETESARKGWAHHGVVITEDSEVIAYHQGDPTVLVFDRDGYLRRSWETDLTESHGMALAKESSGEHLWIADPGAKRQADLGYEYGPGPRKGQVVKMALDELKAQNVIELGKNPGLGVRQLHQMGIDGRGVSIGLVDMSLLREHNEYAGRIRHYEEVRPLAGC